MGYLEPTLAYPFTYTITLTDSLGNATPFTRTVTAPIASDFANVVIGDNLNNIPPVASGYLAGSIKDLNGINKIEIYYGDATNDSIEGFGLTEVFLNALNPHDHNTTFDIYVYDMDGGFSSMNGTIEPQP